MRSVRVGSLRGALIPLLLAGAACSRGTVATTASPPASAGAQTELRLAHDSGAIAFLLREGTERSRVENDLRHLTDRIGPRLTGSPALRRANEWAAARLLAYGADSVALEPWPFGVSWERGPISMRLLAPHERWLQAVSWGWAPGTPGPVAGDVVYMDASSRAEFDQRFAGRLRDHWVMLTAPTPRVNPGGADSRDSARVDSLRQALRLRSQRLSDEQRQFLARLESLLAAEKVAGVIVDGGKDFGLFTMSGGPDQIVPYPQVVVGNQTYAELHRAAASGERARVEVNVTNRFGRDTLIQWNTVGEIRGADLPHEVVLLGAHLDSWDIGTGATDNATGVVAVLEAARLLGALKASGVRPRRTIRFALFTGEEQGLYGSQYYVMAHAAELPRFQAVLVLDNGTGRITSIATQGWTELRAMWTEMMRPFAAPPLGPITVRDGQKTGTDHLAFIPAGVPAFNYDQRSRGYDHTHHSQADVFDHVVPGDVAQAAMVMAVNALQLANARQLLPRRRR